LAAAHPRFNVAGMPSLRAKWIVVALAVLVPLAFAAFTQHAWEDYFITLRTSRNLVEGNGLVFTPGERLHTFTSPLGVLVPALCKAIAGSANEGLTLWLFRFINAGVLAATVGFVWRRFDTLQVGAVGRFTFFGLLLADAKLADFSMNGMETAVLVFFLILLWAEMEAPEGPRAGVLAIACAGLMWTRPDAFIHATAVLVPHLVFRQRADRTKSIPWRPLLRGALIGGALYLPWFAWAWWYYGTPVPHTIIAKSGITAPIHLSDLLSVPWLTLQGKSLLVDIFLPTYWSHGGWPPLIRYFGAVLSGMAAFAWIVPGIPPVARRLSLAVFIGMFYVCAIILFPWYSPPWMVLAALTVAFAADHAFARATSAGRRGVGLALRVACVLVVAFQVALLAASAWQMRVQQRLIEDGVRRPIGEWLRAHAKPGDSVLLEPLGYIGYFSRLKTYDFPGLSSREVVATIRSGVRRYADLIATLRPTWLVLRPSEIAAQDFAQRPVLRDYKRVAEWNVMSQLDAVAYLPGRKWVEWDARFIVFHYEPQETRRTPGD
jgi:hypothetical protein